MDSIILKFLSTRASRLDLGQNFTAARVALTGRLMPMPVLEHSVFEFIERFKQHAVKTTLYPQIEGSPLIEAKLGSQVIYLFDRTGPYSAKHGAALVIVNPVTETIAPSEAEDLLSITGISSLEAVGIVLEMEQSHVIVKTRGVTLVVGVLDDSWKSVKLGQRVAFKSVDAVHGFYLKAL